MPTRPQRSTILRASALSCSPRSSPPHTPPRHTVAAQRISHASEAPRSEFDASCEMGARPWSSFARPSKRPSGTWSSTNAAPDGRQLTWCPDGRCADHPFASSQVRPRNLPPGASLRSGCVKRRASHTLDGARRPVAGSPISSQRAATSASEALCLDLQSSGLAGPDKCSRELVSERRQLSPGSSRALCQKALVRACRPVAPTTSSDAGAPYPLNSSAQCDAGRLVKAQVRGNQHRRGRRAHFVAEALVRSGRVRGPKRSRRPLVSRGSRQAELARRRAWRVCELTAASG